MSKAEQILERPLLRIVVTLSDGETLTREQSFKGLEREGRIEIGDPLPWMIDAKATWDHPQDPVTHTFTVAPEHDQTAREWFDNLTATKDNKGERDA